MWIWIAVAAVFLFLLNRSLSAETAVTGSRVAAFSAALCDGLAMLAFGAGIFGMLMTLVFGVLPDSGPRLIGRSLTEALIWSGGLVAAALVFVAAGSLARKLGAKVPVGAKAAKGGH